VGFAFAVLLEAGTFDLEEFWAFAGFVRTRDSMAESAAAADVFNFPLLSCSREDDLGLPASSFTAREVPAKIFVHPIDLFDFWEWTLAPSPAGFLIVLCAPPMK
jgi:hypothetical protein